MTLQQTLTQGFIEAIELEQKCDYQSTAFYLLSFSPKRLASLGLAIINLSLDNSRTAFGGKILAELSLNSAYCQSGEEISSGSLRVGDAVRLDRMTGDNPNFACEGVITRVNSKTIHISIDGDKLEEVLVDTFNSSGCGTNRMWIVKLTNSVTYQRMLDTMSKLKVLKESDKSDVIQILLGERKLHPKEKVELCLQFWDEHLNESQKEAVRFAIYSSPLTIIHGPPGTGKTYTIVELIKQLTLKLGEKVLVCGASNTSVDNILERLSPSFTYASGEAISQKKSRRKANKTRCSPERLIRIGHPARLLQSNLRHSLDMLSKSDITEESGENRLVIKDIHNDMKKVFLSIAKCKSFSERRDLWSELKQLRREVKQREKKITQNLIANAEVVLSTLHGAASHELRNIYKDLKYSPDKPLFNTIIIDEVSQSLEPQCWIPLVNHLGCHRFIIAGDNQQLSATVESKNEARDLRRRGSSIADLEKTLFDRILSDLDGNDYKRMLNVQYRMNSQIMAYPSGSLYGGQLTAHHSVANSLLSDLSGVEVTDDTCSPCIWYDTQGGDFPEQAEEEDQLPRRIRSNGSKYNELEALVVLHHIKSLLAAGLAPELIGVISPYSAQVSHIRNSLCTEYRDVVEISTIDGFQGREKEAIILSLVRSNDARQIGFLNDPKRLNVAMTRPKRHLCVVGDMELLQRSEVDFLVGWVRHAEKHYEVRYPDITEY